jgi:hypothetical protein
MLSQKPGDIPMAEDPVSASVHDSTAPVFPPATPSQETAVQTLLEALQATPEMPVMLSDFSEYLTSPLDDSPWDDDLLTTPALSTLDMGDILTSPIMGDWGSAYDDRPLFSDSYEPGLFPITKSPVDTTPPTTVTPSIDLHGMWSFSSPQTPTLDQSNFNSPQAPSTKPLPHRRKSAATGTRKNVTPETLVPIDAPTQPRKYVTPSATSRKELPAVFARKRGRSQAFGDEEDQLEDEVVTLPPNPTEQELIEAKRRQNTIAARRSRKRKLEYQRELEETVEAVTRERDAWKARALTCEALLTSHGVELPELFD